LTTIFTITAQATLPAPDKNWLWALVPTVLIPIAVYAPGWIKTYREGRRVRARETDAAVERATETYRIALENAHAALVLKDSYISELERAVKDFEGKLTTANSKLLTTTGAVEDLQRQFQEFKRGERGRRERTE
jgi:hypothetical protein